MSAIPVYCFSPFGGLGDLIIQSFRPLPFIHGAASNHQTLVVVYGDFIYPPAKEFFECLHPSVILYGSKTFVNEDFQKSNEKHKFFDDICIQFLKSKYPSYFDFTIYPHHQNPPGDYTPKNPPRLLTLQEKGLWNDIASKRQPITVIANIARQNYRSIEATDLLPHINPDHQYIQIGTITPDLLPKYELHLPNVKSLLNKTSLNQALTYIDLAHKVICCDSSMLCYVKMKPKQLTVILTNPTQEKYGFQDKSRREDYFTIFDNPLTSVFDTKLNQLN